MLKQAIKWLEKCLRKVFHYISKQPVILGFLIMTTTMIVGFYLMSQAITPTVPFSFDQTTFVALPNEVCAGDTLLTEVSGSSSSQSTVSNIYRTIRGERYFHNYPLVYVATSNEESKPFFRVDRILLPDNIPPGFYEYTHNIIQNNLTDVKGFDVFFSVVEC